jgi:hypothetical protein
MPYWINHALIALGIAALLWWPFGITAGLCAGIAFYAGREIAQWEIYKTFDWKGLVAPLVACAIVFVIAEAI